MGNKLPHDYVAVIEDEAEMRTLLSACLANGGMQTREFDSAEEALSEMSKNAPVAIICDLHLPGIDGLQLREQVRQNSNLVKIPFIFLTGDQKPENRVRAWEKEADGYLAKPFDNEELLALLQSIIRRRAQNSTEAPNRSVFVREAGELVRIDFEAILWVEALGDYAVIKSETASRKVHITMRDLEAKLPSDLFRRCHRSFIVALERIDSIGPRGVQIGGETLPIGASYRDDLTSALRIL